MHKRGGEGLIVADLDGGKKRGFDGVARPKEEARFGHGERSDRREQRNRGLDVCNRRKKGKVADESGGEKRKGFRPLGSLEKGKGLTISPRRRVADVVEKKAAMPNHLVRGGLHFV